MYVSELHGPAGGEPVELHARMTIVRTSDPIRRRWLIDALRSLPAGGDIGAAGALEVHGIGFDTDPGSLALLGLDSSVDPVVTAADLPGHDPELAAVSDRLAELDVELHRLAGVADSARADLDARTSERDAARDALDEVERGEGPAREAIAAAGAERSRLEHEALAARSEVEACERALGEAVIARDALVTERDKLAAGVDAARTRHRAAMDQAIAAAAAREAEQAARPEVQGDPEAEVRAARERLDTAEDAAESADPDRGDSPLARQVTRLERRRGELASRRIALGDGDAEGVAAALAAVIEPSGAGTPVIAALALADTWRDLHQQIGALDAGVSPEERAAEEKVRAAERALIEVESELNQPMLTPEQISRVEQAHSAVLDAQDRVDARFGRARAQRRLEELRADERRVLERLGFSTYADYMMSTSSRAVGDANRTIAETLRTQHADARAELEMIPGATDRARRRADLTRRREEAAPKIAALLGHEPTGPEAEDELRALREGNDESDVDLGGLAGALGDVGIDVGPEPWERDDLLLLARAYIAEDRTASDERERVTEAIDAMDEALPDIRLALRRGEHDQVSVDLPALALVEPAPAASVEPEERVAAAWAEVESARVALVDAELAVDRHRAWKEQLDELDRQLAEATGAEADAAAAVGLAEAELAGDLPERIAAASRAVESAESSLARARSHQADVERDLVDGAGGRGGAALIEDARRRFEERRSAVSEAVEVERAAADELARVEAERADALEDLTRRREAIGSATVDVEAVDWSLLSRLAAVRNVGLAGSVPLVLDDPFEAVPPHQIEDVLDGLLRMASTVQIVIVSDDDAVSSWASGLGGDRAAMVSV